MRTKVFAILMSWATLGLSAERVQQVVPGGNFENQQDVNAWTYTGGDWWRVWSSYDPAEGLHHLQFLTSLLLPDFEVFEVAQEIYIPSGNPSLNFYFRSYTAASIETCGSYKFEVWINLLNKVYSRNACDREDSNDRIHSVDMYDYSGEEVIVRFISKFPAGSDDVTFFNLDHVFLEFDSLIFADSFEDNSQ